MQNEDEALRGFMVGEARSLLDTQRRIEKRVDLVVILASIAVVLILAGLITNTRSFTRLKEATSSIIQASGSLNALAKEMRSGLRDSRTDLSSLKRRVESLNIRLGLLEKGTPSSSATFESGKVAGSAAVKADEPVVAKKKKGCLGIF